MSVRIIHLMSNEADICRKYVLTKLVDAGWDNEPHSFTEPASLSNNLNKTTLVRLPSGGTNNQVNIL
jgi:type I site-specific restriction endonuclease